MSVQAKLLSNMPAFDFAVLSHGFVPYMRDYALIAQFGHEKDSAGTHECLFTHCVVARTETRVNDAVWLASWHDELIDYETWTTAGHPDGYVWGVNWSLAYPGLIYVSESALAAEWSLRLGRSMHEVTVDTNAFFIQLVFHDVKFRHLSGETSPLDHILNPLPRNDA